MSDRDLFESQQFFAGRKDFEKLATELRESGSLHRTDVRHGADCEKVPHNEKGGYLHAAEDDSPYDVDGVSYCGRCHRCLPRVSHIDRLSDSA